MSLHYHRLVARYDASGGPIVLEVVPGGAGEASPVVRRELVGSGRLHALVACCLDAGYSPYWLVLRNEGSGTVQLQLRAWLVHDEYAVVAEAAEPGAVEVPGGLFALLGSWALLAVARRRGLTSGGGRHARAAASFRRAMRASLLAASIASLVALALGVAGAVRYGTDPIVGMMAIMADLPVPGGLFGSRAAFLLALVMLTWSGAFVLWIVAAARAETRAERRRLALLGIALAGTHLAGSLAMTLAYGAVVPVALGLVLALPFGAACALLLRTPRGAAAAT
jgi:hypothetical protein